MTNGYLLRDVVNKVNEIHFTSKDEIHTLGLLYESMLREMRDSAGDSGEFYTPRPVVKFIVTVMDPRLGETILDPAAGTGGFLGRSLHASSEAMQEDGRLQPSSERHSVRNRAEAASLFAVPDESLASRPRIAGH